MRLIRYLLSAPLLFGLTNQIRADDSLLSTLNPAHPRVIATSDDFSELRRRRHIELPLNAQLKAIEQRADGLINAPLLVHEKIGRRLLSVSREALERITTLAMAFQMTHDARYVKRAEAELLNVASFVDWNPSHFLDTAEMAAAVAIGYDWLHAEFSESTKARLRGALSEKSLQYISHDLNWKTRDNNWNSVCYGGLTLAALAIAEHEPELAAATISAVLANNRRVLRTYEPNGVYPEGPTYWVYGTTYQAMLVTALRTALGDDMGLVTPAFVGSGEFIVHTLGPTGRHYNFSDSRDRLGVPHVLHWIAEEAERPEWLRAVQQISGDTQSERRFQVLKALWMQPVSSSEELTVLPLSWRGEGDQPIAVFRTSWNDSNAMYLALKGGSASLNHAHMDAGSFVFESDGVRWAIDPAKLDYHYYEQQGIRLSKRREGGDRWKVFPKVNLAHSTLCIGKTLFDVNSNARIMHYEPIRNGRGLAEVELTAVMGGLDSAQRRFVFDANRRIVTINDRVRGLKKNQSLQWTMLTEAEALIRGEMVTLSAEGRSLQLQTGGGDKGKWSVEPYAPPSGYLSVELPGVSILRWTADIPRDGNIDIVVILRPAA